MEPIEDEKKKAELAMLASADLSEEDRRRIKRRASNRRAVDCWAA